MNEKVQQELLDKSSKFLEQASHTLGQTAVHVYEVLVRQQIVDGIGTIFEVLVLSIIGFISIKWYVQLAKRNSEEDLDNIFGFLMGGILGGSVYFLLIFFLVNALAHGIQQIINPEYYAIEFIFNTAKGK